MNKKAAGRSTSEPKKVNLAAAQSNQERGTGSGKRRVTVPSTASNQLRIDVTTELKDPLANYSNAMLPIRAPEPKKYSTKSPSRTVGKGKL